MTLKHSEWQPRQGQVSESIRVIPRPDPAFRLSLPPPGSFPEKWHSLGCPAWCPEEAQGPPTAPSWDASRTAITFFLATWQAGGWFCLCNFYRIRLLHKLSTYDTGRHRDNHLSNYESTEGLSQMLSPYFPRFPFHGEATWASFISLVCKTKA